MKHLFALTLSAFAYAAPSGPPSKFALEFSVKFDGTPTTMYYAKSIDAAGTPNKKDAALCTIEAGDLKCEGKSIGVTAQLGRSMMDMGALVPVDKAQNAQAISGGFSVDDSGALHWKNDDFKSIGGAKQMYAQQGGEAGFGFFKSSMLGTGQIQFYAQLGCPMGTHDGLHEKLQVGTAKAVAL